MNQNTSCQKNIFMKNLSFICVLFLFLSCDNKTNGTNTISTKDNIEKTQLQSKVESPQNSSLKGTKILVKNKINVEVKPDKMALDISSKNSLVETTPKFSSLDNNSPNSEIMKEENTKAGDEKERLLIEKILIEKEMKQPESNKEVKQTIEQKIEMERKTPKKQEKTINLHDDFNNLLQRHVNNSGVVNYRTFKKDQDKLDAYLKVLEKTIIEKTWSRNKSLAFWINAYNANTIKLILKNYPIKSIMDLNNGKPWDVKWIKIDQRTLSLNNIENDIIRPNYSEPRIHFAVNCAAKSCPPLLNKAWTEGNLNSNLERQTKSFINNPIYNTITSSNVEVSKIFDWYRKDFGDLKSYLNKFSSSKIGKNTSVNFKTYDWNLNN